MYTTVHSTTLQRGVVGVQNRYVGYCMVCMVTLHDMFGQYGTFHYTPWYTMLHVDMNDTVIVWIVQYRHDKSCLVLYVDMIVCMVCMVCIS